MAKYSSEHREPWIDDDGFLRFRMGDVPRTRENVERTFRVAAALTGGSQLPLIVDARAMTSADPRAWVAITENLTSVATSLAILVSDETPAVMNAWQDRFNSLILPCRVFADEESAIAWSKSFKAG